MSSSSVEQWKELLELVGNPPALPGAVASSLLERWLERRRKLLELLEESDGVPEELSARLQEVLRVEQEYVALLRELHEATGARLKLIQDMRRGKEGYSPDPHRPGPFSVSR